MTSAASLQNATASVHVSKHKTPLGMMTFATEPQGRGTWGIFFGCTTTFAFCVWTAMHPNIIPNAPNKYRLFYKGVLMVISIINPEGIAVFAFGQLAEARRIQKEWQAYVEKKHANGEWTDEMAKRKKKLFSMEVAFFIVMGGFTIDDSTAESDKHMDSKHVKRLKKHGIRPEAKDGNGVIERTRSHYTATLTPHGFVHYANAGYFDTCVFHKNEITDKGKASNIAKILSTTQALWLGVQCAARKADRLALSLLEIHVLIQVGCTAIIYLCWWNKPLDVNEPIKLELRNQEGELRPLKNKQADVLLKEEVVELGPDWKQYPKPEQHTKSRHLQRKPEEALEEVVVDLGLDSEQHQDSNSKHLNTEEHPDSEGHPDSGQQQKTILPLHRYFTIGRCPPTFQAITTRALHDIIVYIAGATRKMMLLEGLFIAIIAGLHAVAWNVHFPTETEAWLWRIGCIGMCICPLAAIACASMSRSEALYHVGLAKMLWHNHQIQYTPWQWLRQAVIYIYELAEVQAWDTKEDWRTACIYFHLVILIFCVLLLGGYLLCILYITVAAYISLRDPPNGTFVTPKWSDYWRHL